MAISSVVDHEALPIELIEFNLDAVKPDTQPDEPVSTVTLVNGFPEESTIAETETKANPVPPLQEIDLFFSGARIPLIPLPDPDADFHVPDWQS